MSAAKAKLSFPQTPSKKLVTLAMDQTNSPEPSSSDELRAGIQPAAIKSPSDEAFGWWNICHGAKLQEETTEPLLHSDSEALEPMSQVYELLFLQQSPVPRA